MATDLIHDRGRGPEIKGTRITLYDLIPHFADPDETEESIGRLYGLTLEQVAAARSRVFTEPDLILAKFLQIEAKLRPENSPEVIERMKRTHEVLLSFRNWLAQEREEESKDQIEEVSAAGMPRLPTFKEWLKEREKPPEGKP